MGKFDEVSDEELEEERKARIAKAKAARSSSRDEVVILRGRHAERYVSGNHEAKDNDDDDDDEKDDGNDDDTKSTKSSSTKGKTESSKKPFSYFRS
jgi:hypothetical protein